MSEFDQLWAASGSPQTASPDAPAGWGEMTTSEKQKALQEQTSPEDEFDQLWLASGGHPGAAQEMLAGRKAGAVETFVKSAGGGAVTAAGTTYGAITGARLGKPAGAPGIIAGTVIGGTIGYMGAEEVRETAGEAGFLIDDVYEDVPPDLRPVSVAGETFGGMIATGGAPFALSKLGLFAKGETFVGRWFNSMIETATRHPWLTGASELGVATTASTAGGITEAVFPGNQWARFGAETAGGLLNPLSVGIATFRATRNKVMNVWSKISPAARQAKVGNYIIDVMEQFGDDPVLTARLLREMRGPEFDKLTAAQKTGTMSLAAIEKKLMQESADFRQHAEYSVDQVMDSIREVTNHLAATGDPDMVKLAAEIRMDHIKSLMASRLKIAEKKALQAASQISTKSPKDEVELSRKAMSLVDDALVDARTMEREMWDLVPNDVPATGESFRQTYDFWLNELGPAGRDQMPVKAKELMTLVKKVSSGVDDIGSPEAVAAHLEAAKRGDPTTLTVKDLQQYRSRLLDYAREAAAGGRRKESKVAGDLAEAIREDLDNILTDDVSYKQAREFSKALNDTYTRTFVGKTQATTKVGERMPPELMAHKAMASGSVATDLRLQELSDATEFMVHHARDGADAVLSEQRLTDMLEAQDQLLRLAASRMRPIDPTTGVPGKVSTASLGKFIRENENLLDRFPEVKKDLTEALTSETKRKTIEGIVTGRLRAVEQHSMAAKVLKGNPVIVAQRAALGTNAERELGSLAQMIKRSGGDVNAGMAGLRSSILEGVLRSSTGSDGRVNLTQAFTKLLKPTVGNNLSVLDIMVKQGIIDSQHAKQIVGIADIVQNILKAKKPSGAVEMVEDELGALGDLVTRVVGSSIATTAAGAAGSKTPSLIIAGAGIRSTKKIVDQIPAQKLTKVLSDVMSNPEELAPLLERGKTASQKLEISRRLHMYILTSGILNVPDAIEDETETRLAP